MVLDKGLLVITSIHMICAAGNRVNASGGLKAVGKLKCQGAGGGAARHSLHADLRR
jgi:hypothetical protein